MELNIKKCRKIFNKIKKEGEFIFLGIAEELFFIECAYILNVKQSKEPKKEIGDLVGVMFGRKVKEKFLREVDR